MRQILLSAEAHFWLNGYVNKQSAAFGVKLIHKCIETPLHPEKLTVWCAFYGLVESFSKTMKATTLRSMVYADKLQTPDHLEDNICRVIVDIRPQMLEKVIENWTSRSDYIRASRGSPMPEIIFRIDPLVASAATTISLRPRWQQTSVHNLLSHDQSAHHRRAARTARLRLRS
ncbi:hypothetical protein TNCV_2837671 [Trichonephila clavipes]|nr:hypothetical protein TNCV_2837671 [Trichonephila clavipes]